LKPSRSEFVPLRGLEYHVRLWGDPAAPKLFMVHGWMDVSASFQFLVDALKRDWCVVAPDWRGYGLTRGPATDAYWFADYIADLDFIARHYSPDAPIDLIGHSLGGNVASHYAGARPERVRRLVLLEGFGMRGGTPDEAPARYRRYMDELTQGPDFKPYADFAGLERRLQRNNPRLSDEKAHFLARHWGAEKDGGVVLLADPAHKVVNGTLYRVDEAQACWSAVTAPVLAVVAAESEMLSRWIDAAEYHRRLSFFRDVRAQTVEKAGHMMHHDQPEALAEMIEAFLAAGPAPA
jgi:pimeloyl-ACP methyl ester carboxylesterase